VDAELGDVRVLVGELKLVGRVDLGFELDGLDRRPRQAQRLRAVAALADGLHLKAAAERVRVVLQRDDALDDRGLRVDEHDAALQQPRRVGEGGHVNSSLQSTMLHDAPAVMGGGGVITLLMTNHRLRSG
jgi:hypothetical protein